MGVSGGVVGILSKYSKQMFVLRQSILIGSVANICLWPDFLDIQFASTSKLTAMPRRRWTSTEQFEWLQEWVSGFITAQESKDFNPFFGEVYKAWFTKYPLEKLKAQENGEKIKGLDEAEADGNTEKVEKIRVAWWEQVSNHGHDM